MCQLERTGRKRVTERNWKERATERRVWAFIFIVMTQDNSCTKWTDSEATDPIKEIKIKYRERRHKRCQMTKQREKQNKAFMCKSYNRKTSNLQEPRAGECDVGALLESSCTHM